MESVKPTEAILQSTDIVLRRIDNIVSGAKSLIVNSSIYKFDLRDSHGHSLYPKNNIQNVALLPSRVIYFAIPLVWIYLASLLR